MILLSEGGIFYLRCAGLLFFGDTQIGLGGNRGYDEPAGLSGELASDTDAGLTGGPK